MIIEYSNKFYRRIIFDKIKLIYRIIEGLILFKLIKKFK